MFPSGKAAASDRGMKTAMVAAKALAKTAIEILSDAKLRESVNAEWKA